MAEELLYAEAKLGELLEELPSPKGRQLGKGGRGEPTLPEGITHKDSHYAQKLSRNKDMIPEIVSEARERERGRLFDFLWGKVNSVYLRAGARGG